MRVSFMNEPEDVQWLKDTALAGVPLPRKWAGFQSFVLQGNEDAPHVVNLYETDEPMHDDDFYRVRFVNESPVYAESCEYSGKTNLPYGGLSDLK